ncbi:MAG: ABC transporter substrate-binding protein [Beijerinckiaceae bacterium]|nr:ABC transporter substrate-binding protein [Beijerinckiaceae bacterium]
MKLPLSIAFAENPRTRPVLDGRVTAEGIDLNPSVVGPSELFWRQLRYADFDVAEMSFSSLIIAMSKGDDRFLALPIFTTRRFFHAHILVRRDSGIEKPEDLKGKRVGVTEYQQTGALWTRGALEHEWGVRSQDMEFFMERTPELSHGGATGFKPPAGVTVHQIPSEKSVASMMLSGELHACIHYRGHASIVNRSNVNLLAHPDIRTLFPDVRAEGIRYMNKTGIWPINHGMVIRREIVEKNPWAVINLVKAFDRANSIADAERMEHVEYYIDTGVLPAEARDTLKRGIVKHGIIANRTTLETAAQHSVEQGLTPRLMKLEEIFAQESMEL